MPVIITSENVVTNTDPPVKAPEVSFGQLMFDSMTKYPERKLFVRKIFFKYNFHNLIF